MRLAVKPGNQTQHLCPVPCLAITDIPDLHEIFCLLKTKKPNLSG
jgi:hypothetical protein